MITATYFPYHDNMFTHPFGPTTAQSLLQWLLSLLSSYIGKYKTDLLLPLNLMTKLALTSDFL